MTHYEIVKKLIGEIEPVGETNEDTRRLENTKETIGLLYKLFEDIKAVSVSANRHEFSVREIGITAKHCLDNLRYDLMEMMQAEESK